MPWRTTLTTLAATALATTALISLSAMNAPAEPTSVLLENFTRLDPETQTIIPDSYVVIEGERIAHVGAGEPPALRFASRHDLSGLYALPGFIDAHGHITAGPHAVEMIDGAPTVTIESRPAITRMHAQTALAFGVTTIRNPGGDPVANADYDQRVATAEWIGPDALHAGAVIQPPPFGGNAFAYPQSEAEWQEEAARQAALGMTYFKLYQTLSEEELATGIRVAHEHGLQAIAHLDAVSWLTAVELGMDGLLHALPTSADLLEPGAREAYLAGRAADSTFLYEWFEYADFDGPIMQELFATLAERQIEVDLTLLVNAISYSRNPAAIAFPVEDRSFFHPDSMEGTMGFLAMSGAGWSDEDYERADAAFLKVLEFARRLHAAGVPVMIGTDGPGGGPLYVDELLLHADAGISNWEILRLATQGNATGMGLGAVTGRIAPGFEADLVFLREDPVADIAHAESVEFVVTNGRTYSFNTLANIQDY